MAQDQQTQAIPVMTQGAPHTRDFISANRIHVHNGSLFLDPYLVVHPREMLPGNEQQLRQKLELTFSLSNPSFYESSDRLPVALQLATLLPISLEAKRSGLMRAIETFNNETRTRTDTELAEDAADRLHPFAAIVRDTINESARDPVGMETLKNGLSFYLILREALTRHGYLNRLNEYIRHDNTPDQILASLQDKIGVAPETIMEVARTQGLPGVAATLGIDAGYLKEVNELVEKASHKEFSYNMIEHWHIGRQLLKNRSENITLDDKIAVGRERRILDTMTQLKAKSKGQTEVPEGVKAKERWVAQGLELVPDIQRQLLWDLGYEICFTDEPTADKIAFYPNIYGLHRTTKDKLTDLRGTYRIYFGSKGDQEGSHRTLVHEITHNLWPSLFSPEETANIDTLANSDRTRIKRVAATIRSDFPNFKLLLDAYHTANATPEQRAAILEQANQRYATTLGSLNALFAENKNAYEILDMAEHANDRLHIDGNLYKQSGYNNPEERFREVMSRYAELRFVRLRTEPALVNFLAPGLTRIYDQYYLPHLERLHQHIVAGNGVPQRPVVVAANENTAEENPIRREQPEGDDEKGKQQPQPAVVVANDNETKPKRIDQPEVNAAAPVSIEPPKIEEPTIKAPNTYDPITRTYNPTENASVQKATPVSVEPPRIQEPVIKAPNTYDPITRTYNPTENASTTVQAATPVSVEPPRIQEPVIQTPNTYDPITRTYNPTDQAPAVENPGEPKPGIDPATGKRTNDPTPGIPASEAPKGPAIAAANSNETTGAKQAASHVENHGESHRPSMRISTEGLKHAGPALEALESMGIKVGASI